MAALKHDLTPTLVKYFDRHFVFPMLEFLEMNKIYDETTVNKLKLQQLEKTNMFELYDDTYKFVHGKEPDDDERRATMEAEWEAMEAAVVPAVQLLESEEVTDKLNRAKERDSNSQVMQFLVEKYNFTEELLETLYKCAKFKYDCGHYDFVATFLHMYIALLPPTHKNYVNALWGQVAANILSQKWADARENMGKLRTFIDGHAFASEMEQLQQRAWLIHWTMWISFFAVDAREDLIELCLNPQNMNYQSVMLVVCPHMLRYLTVAVVTSRKRKIFLKDLVRIIKLEQSNYSDPITELVLCLHVKYDFDGAQTKLRECEQVLNNDMFLQGTAADFIENARQLIFEMFCRIHQKITISMLAEKLNMGEEQAERWLVNLIRNAQLNAKIDAAKGQVIMGTRSSSLHEQVMDMTKRLSLRAQSTSVQLEKSAKEKMGAAAYMDMYTA